MSSYYPCFQYNLFKYKFIHYSQFTIYYKLASSQPSSQNANSNRLSHFGTNRAQHTTAWGQAQAARGQAALGAHRTRPPVGVTPTPHQGKEKPGNSLGTHGEEGAGAARRGGRRTLAPSPSTSLSVFPGLEGKDSRWESRGTKDKLAEESKAWAVRKTPA